MIPTPLFSAFGSKVSTTAGHEAILKSIASATARDVNGNAHDKAI